MKATGDYIAEITLELGFSLRGIALRVGVDDVKSHADLQ
jgi:hypothetical protein